MKNLFRYALVLATVAIFFEREARAFPEMVRAGYTNCATCHVNPGGSGVLTEYGRGLSGEILSTWGGEQESKFAWGVVETPEWLGLMGSFRGMQVVQATGNIIEGRPVFMQGDLEAAATIDRFTLVGTVGLLENADDSFGVFSRRHYALARFTDETALRVGKFMQVYGLMPAEHRISIRSGLGWDVETETYNLEASWIGEQLNAFVTGILGRPDDPSKDADTGASATVSWAFSETKKAGWSLFAGTNSRGSRLVTGPFAMIGFTPSLYWVAEADLQSASGELGLYEFQKFGWEVTKGLHLVVIQDFQQQDVSQGETARMTFGPGVTWYPRPHFELQLSSQWTTSSFFSTNLWLGQLNFYL